MIELLPNEDEMMQTMDAMMRTITSQICGDMKTGELELDADIVLTAYYSAFRQHSFEFMRTINMVLNKDKPEIMNANMEFINYLETQYLKSYKDMREFKKSKNLGGL